MLNHNNFPHRNHPCSFLVVVFIFLFFGNGFVNLAFVYDIQDDEDGHLVVLIIIEELMSKTQEEFLDNFARLGVFSKVQALMGQAADADVDVIKSTELAAKGEWF